MFPTCHGDISQMMILSSFLGSLISVFISVTTLHTQWRAEPIWNEIRPPSLYCNASTESLQRRKVLQPPQNNSDDHDSNKGRQGLDRHLLPAGALGRSDES